MGEKQLTLAEKWQIDAEAYKKGAVNKTSVPQCAKCRNLCRNTCPAGTGKTADVMKCIRAARRHIVGIGVLKPGLLQKY